MANANDKDMYVIRLTFEKYRQFAQWLTARTNGTRRYKLPPGVLRPQIEQWLKDNDAEVHEYCDARVSPRRFGRDERGGDWPIDRAQPCKDERNPEACNYNVSIPLHICEDKGGEIDLQYLREYVRMLCDHPEEDAAWALLGMYFLSRCK